MPWMCRERERTREGGLLCSCPPSKGGMRGKVKNTYVNIFVHVTEQLVTTRFSGTLCCLLALL